VNLFFSTRSDEKPVDAAEAILKGIAPDGGLYTLRQFPLIPPQSVQNLDYRGLGSKILSSYLSGFTQEEIERSVSKAYAGKFDVPEIVPLVKAGNRYVLELFHGPTAAFKDAALSILPQLMSLAAKKTELEKDLVILVATSGDTGSSAMHAFADVKGTRALVFYPEKGISPIQKAQMTTMEASNTIACAIRGNFDDAQTGVKKIFSAMPGLSSANSINIGRLAPQIVYYYNAYLSLVRMGRIKMGEPVNFSVPTGNFGDILAGFMAKQSGLPIGTLICASNQNNVLHDFFQTGVYDRRREFHVSISPSMDILVSSNLERLIYWALGCDAGLTSQKMSSLSQNGAFSISEAQMAPIRGIFASEWVDERQTEKTIAQVFRETGYLLDPHTAVAWRAAELHEMHSGDRTVCVVLSTASPFKFPSSVLKAFDSSAILPEDASAQIDMLQNVTLKKAPQSILSVLGKKPRFTDVIDPSQMMAYVIDKEMKI